MAYPFPIISEITMPRFIDISYYIAYSECRIETDTTWKQLLDSNYLVTIIYWHFLVASLSNFAYYTHFKPPISKHKSLSFTFYYSTISIQDYYPPT